MRRTPQSATAGFTLVEMIFYIALLTLVTTASVLLLFSLEDMFAKYRAEQLVYRSATTALERMLFDIRNAESVVTSNSPFPSLSLTKESNTTQYVVGSGGILLRENGVNTGLLTDDDVSVTSLNFFGYSDTTELVRVEMTLSATVGQSTVERTFNAGAVLRGSYEE